MAADVNAVAREIVRHVECICGRGPLTTDDLATILHRFERDAVTRGFVMAAAFVAGSGANVSEVTFLLRYGNVSRDTALKAGALESDVATIDECGGWKEDA